MLVRYRDPDGGGARAGVSDGHVVWPLPVADLATVLAGDLDRVAELVAAAREAPPTTLPGALLAPIDGAMEVWAAGVTYRRSRDARMEESALADPYDRVYLAPRPELFFKSVAWRVSGPGEPVAIRGDSELDVPEPELAAVTTASGEIAGYTLCNDMSSRSIEGENPLYLPQAKIYAGSCALGPGIVLAHHVPDPTNLEITLKISRAGEVVFAGRASTKDLVRPLPDLVAWLYAEQHFPGGAVLSTGTGIVPGLGFTLAEGDVVTVRCLGLGPVSDADPNGAPSLRLSNPVVRGKQAMAWQLTRSEKQ